jgi:putative ABC transport system ATP-binding protein
MQNRILEFESVSFAYENSRSVLRDVSLRIRKGDFVLVKGPSGAGKSTFLRLCCRLEEPDAGMIKFEDAPLASIEPAALRRKVCYMQQTPTLAPGSIVENLLLPFTFKASRGVAIPSEDTVRKMLDEFELSMFGLRDSALNMSVGQRQRLCLIRTILLEPEIMLLDEPTSALDEKSAEIVMNRTLKINREKNVTVLAAAHAPRLLKTAGARVLTVEDGKAAFS